MVLPANEWHTTASLAKRWDMHIDDIECKFISGDLIPSIRRIDGLELYEVRIEYNDDIEEEVASQIFKHHEIAEEGIYDIVNYNNIAWDYDDLVKQKTALLSNTGRVYLSRCNRFYSIVFGLRIKKDYIIVTAQEVERYEASSIVKNVKLQVPIFNSDSPKYSEKVLANAAHGEKFIGNGKSLDQLTLLIEEILTTEFYKNKKFPDWNSVVNILRRRERTANSLIDEVDTESEAIFWGVDKEISFKALRNRLTEARKRITKKNIPS